MGSQDGTIFVLSRLFVFCSWLIWSFKFFHNFRIFFFFLKKVFFFFFYTYWISSRTGKDQNIKYIILFKFKGVKSSSTISSIPCMLFFFFFFICTFIIFFIFLVFFYFILCLRSSVLERLHLLLLGSILPLVVWPPVSP